MRNEEENLDDFQMLEKLFLKLIESPIKVTISKHRFSLHCGCSASIEMISHHNLLSVIDRDCQWVFTSNGIQQYYIAAI